MSSVYSISVLKTSSSGSSKQTSSLSEETEKKLKALGIDVNSVSSETEAKKLIAEEEAKQGISVDEEENDTSESETLYNDIKNLGRKLGISVSENENIEDLFDKISERFEELQDNSYNSNLNVLQAEFDRLKQEYKNMYTGESSILSAMDMMSQSNRAALGI